MSKGGAERGWTPAAVTSPIRPWGRGTGGAPQGRPAAPTGARPQRAYSAAHQGARVYQEERSWCQARRRLVTWSFLFRPPQTSIPATAQHLFDNRGRVTLDEAKAALGRGRPVGARGTLDARAPRVP